ncbi:MAG: 2-succinyl-5-enolpyruvyl-6-hydroxy-3-cyclohexene-1-carboxylic-acid synthase [Acidimicrobiales bacterium]
MKSRLLTADGLPVPENSQATFCATLVDEWVRGGVEHAVVCPGSRSTPLTLALDGNSSVTVHVRLDERSAGFFALGLAAGTARPVVVCVTSGTAAAELHAAVVEAHYQGVPLLVCTADRPAELRLVGAPQTVDQVGIYASSTRFAVDIAVAEWELRHTWRSLAARSLNESLYGPHGPGPVHLNLQFRGTLVGHPLELPEGRPGGRMWHSVASGRRLANVDMPYSAASHAGLLESFVQVKGVQTKGIIVAGQCKAQEREQAKWILLLAEALAWPLLADPLSMCRVDRPGVIAGADGILSDEHAREVLRPDVVLRFGRPWASKTLNAWLADLGRSGVEQIIVDPYWQWVDPERTASLVVNQSVEAVCRYLIGAIERDAPPVAGGHSVTAEPFDDEVPLQHRDVILSGAGQLPGGSQGAEGDVPSSRSSGSHPSGGYSSSGYAPSGQDWLGLWQAVEDAVQARLDRWCTGHGEITGPGVARILVPYVSDGGILVVSSSLPIRDVERYGAKVPDPPVAMANRGANGIDGVVSTAMGAAAGSAAGVTPRHVVALVGDLAFLHDLTSLVRPFGAAGIGRLTVIVLDNGGGGIFSLLPQAGLLDSTVMERLFTARQEPGIEEVARGLGADVASVETIDVLQAALRDAAAGEERPVRAGGAVDSMVKVIRADAPGVTDSATLYDSIQRELARAARGALDTYLSARGLTSR